GASLLLGPLFAKSVAALAPIARQANVPVVAFSNDRQVAGRGVYLLSFQPATEIARVVLYATQQGKRRFAALIPDDAFGKVAAAALKEAADRGGGDIIALETYPASANGMLEPMRKVGLVLGAGQGADGGQVDALFLPGGQENLERIARLMPQAEIDPAHVKVLGTGGMDYANAGQSGGLVGAWYPGPDPAGGADFAQEVAKRHGQAPAANGRLGLGRGKPRHPAGRGGRGGPALYGQRADAGQWLYGGGWQLSSHRRRHRRS